MASEETTDDTNCKIVLTPPASPSNNGPKQSSPVGRCGFPRTKGQSLSYWLEQVRCDELLDYRSSEALPNGVDCVVIGSGITGCLAAKHYNEAWPNKSVIILEALDFCSGATGRNAGHCKPFWRGFTKYEQKFGSRQAIEILENEQETWNALVAYVRDYNVDCDLWVGDTFDVPMTPAVASAVLNDFIRYRAAGGRVDHVKATLKPEEAVEITRIRGAQACYTWPASTLQPRKLTAHIMRTNLERGIGLHTFTVVNGVTPSSNDPYAWCVNTTRGSIDCDTVIHATNAYAAAYEPLFRPLIRPMPHMCNKVVPPISFSGSRALKNSYTVLLPGEGSISINPRCTSDGVILFGGTNPGQKKLNEWVDEHTENCVNDGLANVQEVTREVQKFVESNFDGWDDAEKIAPESETNSSWSGIIAMTSDRVPLVGEIPGKKGQWACIGHNGHGMARTFTAAPGLVRLMKGESWDSTGLPKAFELTSQRLSGLRQRPRI